MFATLLIGYANSTVLFNTSECEMGVTTSTLILLMIDITTSLCLEHTLTNYIARQECNPISPYMVKNGKVRVNNTNKQTDQGSYNCVPGGKITVFVKSI